MNDIRKKKFFGREIVRPGSDETFLTAGAWLARLQDDDVAVEDIAEWQAWLAEDETHRAAYAEVERAWALAGRAGLSSLAAPLSDIAADDYGGDEPVSEWIGSNGGSGDCAQAPRAGRVRMIWTACAASLFALVAAVLFVADQNAGPAARDGQLTASISTQIAEHRTARLFDGTAIDVGGASRLAIDFTGAERLVELSEGEAFFDVASDPDQPFVVKTPLGRVTAVGTAFNVRLAHDRLVVTVTEGEVDVASAVKQETGAETMRIAAGSMLAWSEREASQRPRPVETTAPLSWREGRFVYRAEPLRYVVSDINRYADIRIELADDAVGALSYSGTMRPAAVEEWANALAAAFPVTVERRGQDVIRIQTRS